MDEGTTSLVRAVGAVAVAVLVCAMSAQGAVGQFTAQVTNQWFPLTPGTQYTYKGVKDGKPSRDVVTVTHRVVTINGAPCVSVEDRLYLNGRLEERTTDWYSQDSAGNVWYFGERTAELDRHGHVTSTEGSWRAGVDGAVAGIYMPAAPHLGQSGRQEYYKGHAEDRYKVIGVFPNAVLTQETTRLEPDVVDHKLYVRGLGTAYEQTERGGDERNELVSVKRL